MALKCLSHAFFYLLLNPEQELDQQKYIYTKGCVGQFEKWLQDNLIVVAGMFVGVALLQVNIILLQGNDRGWMLVFCSRCHLLVEKLLTYTHCHRYHFL